MPVSKRDKKVSLTNVPKKGKEMKQKIITDIRELVEKYDNLFVFASHNMRNSLLKNLREQWKEDSRFLFAKKKLMAVALGRTEAEEAQKNLHKLSSNMVGQCGLLFTNKPKSYVTQWFRDYSDMEYAKSGYIATETVTIPAGPLSGFAFSLEPRLRSLGLPTQLVKGQVVMREEYTVCTKGVKVTPEQANMLKLMGKQIAEFKLTLLCVWSKDGSFEKYKIPKELQDKLIPKENIPKAKVDTPKQDTRTPKQKKNTPDQKKDTPTEKITTPKTGENVLKQPIDTELEPSEVIEKSPKLEKRNPRRSMRTPRQMKRTPDHPKQSVKKLTESAKHLKKTPKQTPTSTKSKQLSAKTKRMSGLQNKEQDVKMAE